VATQTLPPTRRAPDVPARLRTLHRWRARLPKMLFLRRLVVSIVDDDVTDLGAMMAYYAVLSLFPMLVFIVTMALLVIDPATIHEGVLIATRALPESGRQLISEQVTNFINASLGGALDRIMKRTETRPWWRRQLIAIAVTASVALMVVVALGLLVLGPSIGSYLGDVLGGAWEVAWEIGRWIGAGFLVMLVWAIAYYFLPDSKAPFRLFSIGSFVGIAMWIAVSLGFNYYLTRFGSYETTYGALGGAIVFLTWLWLSNIALLVGAEVNAVLGRMRRERAEAFLADETVRSLTAQGDTRDTDL
jgi:membrane protein